MAEHGIRAADEIMIFHDEASVAEGSSEVGPMTWRRCQRHRNSEPMLTVLRRRDQLGQAIGDGRRRLGRTANVAGLDQTIQSIVQTLGWVTVLAPTDHQTVAVGAEGNEGSGRVGERGKGLVMAEIDCRAAHEKRR